MKILSLRRLKKRERIVLAAGLLIAMTIIGSYCYEWYGQYRAEHMSRLSTKKLYLEKQTTKISEMKEVQDRLYVINAEMKDLEKGLLVGEKPSVAAAELQRVIKDAASALAVEIRSEKILNPVEHESYTAIQVEVSFAASTAKLRDMLQFIEGSNYYLAISDMRVRVVDIKNTKDLQVVMTLRGYIKNTASDSGEDRTAQKTKSATGKVL
ncbi:MAG: type II secretion system protein GspM [Dissulfurispiraceae bacterium]|jgi:hypothetical protein|nr:type II secretion system protein GspM [Dissulfurispiraceae bacterium]